MGRPFSCPGKVRPQGALRRAAAEAPCGRACAPRGIFPLGSAARTRYNRDRIPKEGPTP